MSEQAIRSALETRLQSMSPALPTQHENDSFEPTVGVPYQRTHLMRGQPENPVYGSFHRAQGIFQVTMYYPQGSGPGAAEARAELTSAHFPRGLPLTNGGVTVTINREPYIMAGFKDGSWWAVPVRIIYFSNIN